MAEQLPVVSALAAILVLAHACDLTNATLPLGQFPESQRPLRIGNDMSPCGAFKGCQTNTER